MKIGIVIAITRELKAFLESDYEVEIIKEGNREIYKTIINGNEIFATKSGFGKIDAVSATQFLITKYDVSLIINFGVTGALQKDLKVEDLFIVKSTINYDYDVSLVDPVKPHQYEEFNDEHIPLDEEYIKLVKGVYPGIKETVCASGDSFVAKVEDKINLNKLGCSICDMEIAGIARTCYLNGIKCFSIKCISDSFDGDGRDFEKNVINSANKAFILIKEILNKIA